METLKRKNIRRKGNLLIIDLPESFQAIEMDVLVYPSQVDDNSSKAPSMSDYLMDWPDLEDDDLKYIEDKRKHLREWI